MHLEFGWGIAEAKRNSFWVRGVCDCYVWNSNTKMGTHISNFRARWGWATSFIVGIDFLLSELIPTAAHVAPPNPLEIAERSCRDCRATRCRLGSRGDAGLG